LSLERLKARGLYIRECLPTEAIAARLGIGERTVQRWKADDLEQGNDWDAGCQAAHMARENIEISTQIYIANFVAFQQGALADIRANEDMTPGEKAQAVASLADSFSKTVKACAVTAPKISSLAIAVDIVQRLAAFVADRHPEAAQVLTGVLEPFMAELAREYE